MNIDLTSMTDLLVTNGVLGWIGLRLIKRVDTLDNKVDDHEARLQVTEHQMEHGGN